MTKTVSTSKKPRKQHSPEFRSEALKLAERIGVTAAARESFPATLSSTALQPEFMQHQAVLFIQQYTVLQVCQPAGERDIFRR